MNEHPLITEYRNFSPNSAAFSARASQVFPGGDTRASAHYKPYPLAIERAAGSRLYDVDGHELIDFMNNFTSLIHGHAHPEVVAAIQQQAPLGSAYAACNDAQVELAELIQARVPSIEQLRFTSSGTEATLMAIRCARAATGRQKIMKMEGGYHGSYELAEVSLVPHPQHAGELHAPASTPVDPSFPASVLEDTVICPYNEPQLARHLIERHNDDLAAIIVEPMLGSMGMVPATAEFLQCLRAMSQEFGIVLIFDEVITFRLSAAGAQAQYQVTPDLTCLGKIIGGGLPVGAVGGRRDLMALFSPDSKSPVMHASTFSGNAMTMAAGLAAMRAYTDSDAERINRLGEQLRSGFNREFKAAGINAQMFGNGSLSNILFAPNAPKDSRDSLAAMISAGAMSQLLHLGMLRRGIYSAARLMYAISTPMTSDDIDLAISALKDTLAELKPYIERANPHLLVA